MERLTIKELAPYATHGLRIKLPNGKIKKIKSIDFELRIINFGWKDTVYLKDETVLPLLRPFSQLTEEIEHNSISIQLEPSLEKVKPSELIYKHWFYTIREDGHFSYHIGDGTVIGSLYRAVPYSLIEILLEWHFDVFGLIDRGLALPIDGKEVENG